MGVRRQRVGHRRRLAIVASIIAIPAQERCAVARIAGTQSRRSGALAHRTIRGKRLSSQQLHCLCAGTSIAVGAFEPHFPTGGMTMLPSATILEGRLIGSADDLDAHFDARKAA